MKYISVLFLLLFTLLIVKCTDPSVIGGNLVEDELINLQSSDTFTISAKTIPGDSILVYDNESGLRSLLRYLVGKIEDPVFGSTEVLSYGQLRMEAENRRIEDYSIDSVVLTLVYSDGGFYGDPGTTMDLEIFELQESLTSLDTIYSNQYFEEALNPIGGLYDYLPKPQEPFIQIDSSGGSIDTLELDPRVRIKIDHSFGEKILDLDSVYLSTNEMFLSMINGISIRAGSSVDQILAFDLLNQDTELTIYFKEEDSKKQFKLFFSDESVKSMHYELDYTAAIVSDFLSNPEKGDSLLFVQGNAGTNIEFNFPHLNTLNDVLINSAELELIFADLVDLDTIAFPPMQYLNMKYRDDDGRLIEVPDKALSDALTGFNFESKYFGGYLEEWEDNVSGMKMYRYRFNLSTYIQELVDQNTVPNLYIESRLQPIDVSRSVVFGPGHSKYPMKLRLTYTQK